LIKEPIKPLLRSPVRLKPLEERGNFFFAPGEEIYPIIDGIICMLLPEERARDLGDKKFYDKNPFGQRNWQNNIDIKFGVERDLDLILEKLSKTDLIIDVGSGTGRISIYLDRAGYHNVVSLDFSYFSLLQVRQNSSNVCIWGNNLHLPFASNSFDFVISSGVIHHTPEPLTALKECVRILKPGGTLYLKTYNLWSPYCLLYFTYGSIMRFFERSELTQKISDLLGFSIYKFIRRFIYRLPKREDRILRAQFNNLFMKSMVSFLTKESIEIVLDKCHIVVERYKTSSPTHRMHCYVGIKKS